MSIRNFTGCESSPLSFPVVSFISSSPVSPSSSWFPHASPGVRSRNVPSHSSSQFTKMSGSFPSWFFTGDLSRSTPGVIRTRLNEDLSSPLFSINFSWFHPCQSLLRLYPSLLGSPRPLDPSPISPSKVSCPQYRVDHRSLVYVVDGTRVTTRSSTSTEDLRVSHQPLLSTLSGRYEILSLTFYATTDRLYICPLW